MSTLITSSAWRAIKAHREAMTNVSIAELFLADRHRYSNFSIELDGLLLDFSKNLVTDETVRLLVALAQGRNVLAHAERMFSGEKINTGEKRAALHTALRSKNPVTVDGQNVLLTIHETRERMRVFSDSVRANKITGRNGKKIKDVVSIGIGGSHLGPALAIEALAPYASGPRVHFVSNIDPAALARILPNLEPSATLFIIASKTFTTLETLTNAESARRWAGSHARFAAITARPDRAIAFGIEAEHIFPMHDWIGGRYSLWSAVGLPVVLAIGMEHFEEMLAGAEAVDTHFRRTPFSKNMPVMLALLGLWYNNFFGSATHAVLPYDESLALLPAYLQQLDMESSGKRTTHEGVPVDYDTGPVIWGATGTNGQHAFFQLLHQGTRLIPADFIAACRSHYEPRRQHDMLIANFLAQTAALMQGDGKTFPGNRPSNSILISKLTPRTFGMLIALYEHKVFVQNAIWDINAFDQPGVELGKQLALGILPLLEQAAPPQTLDNSTQGLIGFYKSHR